MATLREYFDTDSAKVLCTQREWRWESQDKSLSIPFIAKIAYDFNANAKYMYFFIDRCPDIYSCIISTINSPEAKSCSLGKDGNVDIVMRMPGDVRDIASSELDFTRRMFFYVNEDIESSVHNNITEFGNMSGLRLILRDKGYAMERAKWEKPMAFVSHDSRDKDSLVRELVRNLSQFRCPVWYDEYSLKVGDSLRESIERGLRECRKCVLVLSPNFLANDGWGKVEFNSVFTREIIEKQNVILPIWHNVDAKRVYEYSPILADKMGIKSTIGVEEMARKLVRVIMA